MALYTVSNIVSDVDANDPSVAWVQSQSNGGGSYTQDGKDGDGRYILQASDVTEEELVWLDENTDAVNGPVYSHDAPVEQGE